MHSPMGDFIEIQALGQSSRMENFKWGRPSIDLKIPNQTIRALTISKNSKTLKLNAGMVDKEQSRVFRSEKDIPMNLQIKSRFEENFRQERPRGIYREREDSVA